MQRVYFDESGQTGTHLLDAEQPWFVLASTDVGEAEAAEILGRCFPGRQGKELKSRSILKGARGRRQYLEFAREVGKDPDRFCAAKIDKRFSVVGKMVDNLVEPPLHAQGYDFYADDYARKFANSAFYVFSHLLDPAVAEGLLVAYNDFAREPNSARLAALQAALKQARRDAPYGSEVTLDLMSEGADAFDRLHDLANFRDTNELHVTAAVSCMGHWRSRHRGPFEVVHDESVHFFSHSVGWEMMTNPEVEPASFEMGGKALDLPIPVTATVSARSHECAPVQLCDLLAGLISRSGPGASREIREFASETARAGLGGVSIFPITAGNEFAGGPPRRAAGPDVVDRIIKAVRRRDQGRPPTNRPGETG